MKLALSAKSHAASLLGPACTYEGDRERECNKWGRSSHGQAIGKV